MFFLVLLLFGLPTGPAAVLDLTAELAPLLVGLWVILGLCLLGLGVAVAIHDTGWESRPDTMTTAHRVPLLRRVISRSLKLFKTHRQALPSLAAPRGPQVSPSFLRASLLQTSNQAGGSTTREQSHSTELRPVLQTEHLSRIVAATRLVDDVSLSVWEGEVLAVIGPSGAGKSSFLRLLNRLDEPTKGTVYLAGQDYRQIPPRELRRRVGLVTQTPFLFPGTIADNLRFGPRQRGEELPEEMITLLLEQVGLADQAQNDTAHLSGGEAQRVSLARALANSPTVLLLDEPTSALDDEAKAEVEALLRQIVRQHRLTCVMVSHDRAQAARLADRVMLLKGGRLEKIGSTREVFHGSGPLH